MTRRSISAHALEQAARRGLDEATIAGIAERPGQVIAVRPGREVRQAQFTDVEGKPYVVRVFVDIAGEEETVVTVYKTSKVAKYWRES